MREPARPLKRVERLRVLQLHTFDHAMRSSGWCPRVPVGLRRHEPVSHINDALGLAAGVDAAAPGLSILQPGEFMTIQKIIESELAP